MAEPTRAERLKRLTPETIEDLYRRGRINAADRNKLMREKARSTVAGLLEEDGFFRAIWERTIHQLQEGWDSMVKGAAVGPGPEETEIKEPEVRQMTFFMGMVQALTAPLNAIGEVTGQVAENMALDSGASPGLARVINIATDIGSGFAVPTGLAAKGFVKGAQKVGKVAQKLGEKLAAKAGEEAVESAGQVASRVIREGLDVERGVAKAAGEAVIGPKTFQQQFADDLARFRKEMEAITTPQVHEETARLAKKLGLTLDDLQGVVPGQALDERQMFAYLKALEPQVDQLFTLAKTAAKEGTEEVAHALARHAAEFFTIAPKFRGAEITAGRAVEILKETPPMKKITDMLMGWDPDSLAKGDFAGAMKTMAEDLIALDKEKLTQFAIASQRGFAELGVEWWARGREFYINVLLSRPLTHVRNAIGNSVAATNEVLERLAGGVFSIDKQAGLVGKEGLYQAKGMMLAMGDGLKAFANAYRTLDPSDISKLDYIPHRIPGALGRIINLPGDSLRGMDNFFKTIVRRGTNYASALRDGVHSGLTGKELSEFVARRVTFPTDKMVKEADEVALKVTFQNELGGLQAKAKGLQTGPLALWFPFMKTPLNLANYAWNRTPGLQLLSKSLYDDIAAGGVRADMAIGRLTLSNLQAMFIYELAQEGMITGSGPVDPALRKAWLATHQPYSVKTKDGWIPISNTEPGSITVGLVADFAQVHNQLDDPTAEQTMMAVTFAVMKDLADKTYWQTVGDLVDIASGITLGHTPGKGIRDVLMSPVTTVITGGPVGAAVARAVDPIRRETRTWMDSVTARVPGYSSTLPPLRDGYGDPVLPPQAIGGPWVGIGSPLLFKPHETDRVKLEGDRLQAKLPRFQSAIGGSVSDEFDITEPQAGDRVGVELSPQERDTWQRKYRFLIRHPEHGIERQLLNNPLYKGQTRAMQREMFSSTLSDYKATAKELLFIENPDLAKRVLESDAARVAPLLKSEDQEALQEQVRETISLYDTMTPEMRDNLLRWGMTEEEPTP